jgi:hypothetical protein
MKAGRVEVSTIRVRLWVVTQAAVRSQYHPRDRVDQSFKIR